jgi:hypothetical protein
MGLQYNFQFYLEYLARWPEYCQMAVGQDNMAYGAPTHPLEQHSVRRATERNECMYVQF